MEKLHYVVEDSTIAELLGVQNFTNEESAILELVKNAYDAHAQKVEISFENGMIRITDDGDGMDRDTIIRSWMRVGKSEKGYITIGGAKGEKRIMAGSKGIGRFALARLGAHAVVYSVKKESQPVVWTTDWVESSIDSWDSSIEMKSGTMIEITKLRDKWTPRRIESLIDYLSITCKDYRMLIDVRPCANKAVKFYFSEPKIGKNCVAIINLRYDSQERNLHYDIESDEFVTAAREFCPDINLKKISGCISMASEFENNKDSDYSKSDIENKLTSLGDFSCEFYFSLKSSTKRDVERFFYKYESLPERYESGIVLYRNAFSISSFEGTQDWLGLNSRTRQSPAAATHQTGAWRVRSNQISGKVQIDKKENSSLVDLSNRQGLVKNEHYAFFVNIIIAGISVFERYRQSIIRRIDKEQKTKKPPNMLLINQIIQNFNRAINLSDVEARALSKELQAIRDESKEYKVEKENVEERYRYDVRILNVLATSGLRANSIAHEMQNDRNEISENSKYIVDALKEYGMWEELNSTNYTKLSHRNVPRLLERNSEVNQKLLVFMDSMLNKIEKRKFLPASLNVSETLDAIKAHWERDYASLCIMLDVSKSIQFNTSEDVFIAIFDNLLLNSWQQNKQKNKITVEISVQLRSGYLFIRYSDDGLGLPEKYRNSPLRILEVHETSRPDGHGLGMWIVNNTIEMTGGEVININGINGFRFCFQLGEEL